MGTVSSTTSLEYTERLIKKQDSGLKKLIKTFDPYKHHIRKVIEGKTLEVGCGIGRVIGFSPEQIVGVDHNAHSIETCQNKGFQAFRVEEFQTTFGAQNFQTLIMSHLLEHMSIQESVDLINFYKPYLVNQAKVIAITPQEVGYRSDHTHAEFVDFSKLREIFQKSGVELQTEYSFPFPRFMGKIFIYNEFVAIGRLRAV
jgi:SAM-dependent methyltransferase